MYCDCLQWTCTARIRLNSRRILWSQFDAIFGSDFHDFIDENFCWDEKPRSQTNYITIDKSSSDSNTYCLHFLRYYFLSNNVEERPVFEILQKIEILQYPDADAEEKFLLNLEGRKGAGGPS